MVGPVRLRRWWAKITAARGTPSGAASGGTRRQPRRIGSVALSGVFFTAPEPTLLGPRVFRCTSLGTGPHCLAPLRQHL